MDSKAVGVLEDLKKIAAQEGGFSFGELWRYDKDSITAVLPIIHSNGLERGYVTSAEAGKSLVITDTGSIDAVKLENKADQAVLIRTGEIIEGDTQERTFIKSVIIAAHSKMRAYVNCVNAIRPIHGGKNMYVSKVSTPRNSRAHFYRAKRSMPSQMKTWDNVQAYTDTLRRMSSEPSGFLDSMSSARVINEGADLTTAQKRVQETFRDVTKAVPKTEDQVGFVLITIDGVEGMETFNHPKSYESVRDALLSQDASTIGQARKDSDSVFEFHPERAAQQARELLSRGFGVEEAVGSGETEVFHLTSEKVDGEAVY